MKPLGLSGSELARQLKVPANRINDVVRNRREITADTALRLAHYFGTTARIWLSAQAAYNLSRAESEDAGRIASQVRRRAA
jgi:addiction module HigA family antidote